MGGGFEVVSGGEVSILGPFTGRALTTLDGKVLFVGLEVWVAVTESWPPSVEGPFRVDRRGHIKLFYHNNSPLSAADCYADRGKCEDVVAESVRSWERMGYGTRRGDAK